MVTLSAGTSTAATSPTPGAVSAKYTYDLATANGGVRNFGGARFYGSARQDALSAPIVGITPTRDLLGYWLVGATGEVFAYGDARNYGSLGAGSRHVVALLASADDRGYWIVTDDGVLSRFGDARPLGPDALPAADLWSPIVAAAALPDGLGAWLTNAEGDVFTLGKAVSYGSLTGVRLSSPVTGIAATPSGQGYWLTEADGQTFHFGNALGGRPAAKKLAGSVVGISPTEDNRGFWEVSDDGSVLTGGDATTRGSTSIDQTGSPVVGIALAQKYVPGVTAYPSGAIGYDINWPQCGPNGSSKAGDLPGPPKDSAGSRPYTVAIVGVDGWAVDDDNPCLAAEVSWAKKATEPAGRAGTPAYELYLFLNSPSSTSTIDGSGPAGTCADKSGSARDACLAYNYGYNSAADAMSYASSQGARAKMWWLDVENDACAPGMYNDAARGEFWSCNQRLNSDTIQAALDALRAAGIDAGIYSTAVQYQGITGDYVPSGGSGPLPLWVAGAYWTSPPYPSSYGYPSPSANSAYCAGGSYAFAGGKPVLLQETPGSNDYPFDPDYAC
jgi:hypothetical protein